MPTGEFNSSISAWDDGQVTYHLRRFSGYMFEVYERLEISEGWKIIGSLAADFARWHARRRRKGAHSCPPIRRIRAFRI